MLFGALAQRLDDAFVRDEDRTRDVLLPYVKDKLAGWPARARSCPRHRLREYESGEPVWCELVRALDYQNMVFEEGAIKRLLQVLGVEHVTHLDLSAAEISWEQLACLATNAPFQLESFAIARNAKIDWDALDTLFSSSMFSTVERLSFRGWAKIRVDVYKHLAEHFQLENLRALDVSGGAMSARKLGELVRTGRLDQLEEFYARTWTTEAFKPGMIGVFAQHPNMQNLRVIEVAECKARELEALAGAEHLSSLRELRLGTAAELEHLDAVLNAPQFSELERLSLFVFDWQSRGYEVVMSALADSSLSEKMRALQFTAVRRPCTYPDVEELLGEQVHLSNALQANGFEHLTRFCVELNSWMMNAFADHAVAFPELEQLMIFGRGLSDPELREAALRLFTRQNFPKLDTLVVNMTDPAPVFDALEQNDLAIKNLKVVTYGADALTHLLSGEYLAHIEVLDMSSLDCYHSKLLGTVFASPHLKGLRAVVVDGWPSFKYVTQALRAHPGLDSSAVYVCEVEDADFKTFDWVDV